MTHFKDGTAVLLLLGTVVCFAPILAEAKSVPAEPGRIVNGQDANIKDFPYQVAVLLDRDSLRCGGSILNVRFVLTAAHCTDGRTARELSVRAGSTEWAKGGQEKRVRSIAQHPQYDASLTDFDVAVLKLRNKLKLGASVKPVPLVRPGGEASPGTVGTVAGWGDLESGANAGSPTLMSVELAAVSREDCRKSYGSDAITDRMICFGDGSADSCQGDSGGPIVVDGVQVGIVSFGEGCATPGTPGVYTNIAYANISNYIEESLNS